MRINLPFTLPKIAKSEYSLNHIELISILNISKTDGHVSGEFIDASLPNSDPYFLIDYSCISAYLKEIKCLNYIIDAGTILTDGIKYTLLLNVDYRNASNGKFTYAPWFIENWPPPSPSKEFVRQAIASLVA